MVSLLGNVQPFTPLEEGRAVASREDEIDLVGVGVALVRIWQLVVGVFVPSGVIVALLKKPEYAYSAGGGATRRLRDDQWQYRASCCLPDSAKSLLQRGLINAGISYCA